MPSAISGVGSLVACVLVVSWAAAAAPKDSPKAAPRSDKYDRIVDDFIRADVGELRGQEGRAAMAEFYGVNTEEAIPALVRGVNKAANVRASCPIMMVSSKLQHLSSTCRNTAMLRQAYNDLSAEANSPYGNYVSSLKQYLDGRLTTLEGREPKREVTMTGGTPGQLRRSRINLAKWTFKDLEEAVAEDADEQLMRVLEEIASRQGSEYTELLARAVAGMKPENQEIARGLLAKRLMRMTDETLREKLKDQDAEVRAMAARAAGYKGLTAGYAELAALLRDRSPVAAAEAKATLVKLSGEDFGPPEGAKGIEWYEASKRWEKWLQEKK